MKKILYICVAVMWWVSQVNAQPQISYIIPDIGAPGMSTYMEIIGPFDPNNPGNSRGNFRFDGLISQSVGEVRCLRASDKWKLTFSPMVVSWDGRMVSVQVFINPILTPNSDDWEVLIPEYRIPIVVQTLDGVSNVDTFYIVQPWQLGNISANSERIFGVGTLGKRSRRGAMLVDSLILANAEYSLALNGVAIKDCDPGTVGNQGYLPFTLISKGKITGSPNTSINVSGQKPSGGNAGNGGPGGGGGGGRFCDIMDNGDVGGNGFVSGGKGGTNLAMFGGSLKSYGQGTGTGGYSLNGAYPPKNSTNNWEASGGGTGHPFGMSGIGTYDGNTDNPVGGFGGGSGFRQNKNGGSGGFATSGANSNRDGSTFSLSGGWINGNDMGVPIAGGSGGGSGNPNSVNQCSGSGGGGGGAISIYAPYINNIALISNGAYGGSGTDGDVTRGGSGSGGFVSINTKLALNQLTLTAEGGRDQGNTVTGGAGRMRYDVPSWIVDNTNIPANASKFRGPTTDSLSYVKRNFTLNGTRGTDRVLYCYVKPESKAWVQVTGINYSGNDWSVPIDLSGKSLNDDFCSDSLFYFVVFQEESVTGTIDVHNITVPFVLSQAATNIFKVIPDIQGDDNAQMHITVCAQTESDTVEFVIKNAGGPTLSLNLNAPAPGAYFDTPANGTTYNGFKMISPNTNILLSSCESQTFTVSYTYQPGHSGIVSTTLFIPHNDKDPARKNPWEVDITVVLDSFVVASYDENDVELTDINVLDLGQICLGDSITKNFKIKNHSSFDINLMDFEFSDEVDKFSGQTISSNFITVDGETDAYIKFSNPDAVRQYRTRVYIKPIECEFAVDSFDVYVEIVENKLQFSQNFVIVDTVHFGQVKIGYSKRESVDVTNDGTGQALISTIPVIIPPTQTEFSVAGVAPVLPVLLTPMDGSKMTIDVDFLPLTEGYHSATLTVISDDSDSPVSCPSDGYVILFAEGIKSEVMAYPIDFGLLAYCEGLQYDTIFVTNTGQASVDVISSAEILGADSPCFRLINPPQPPFTIGIGDTAFYLVEFDPSIPMIGSKSATFHLVTNDTFEPDIYTVITAETDSIYVDVNPSLLNFSKVAIPEDRSVTVVITNNGRFLVQIDKVVINYQFVKFSSDPSGSILAPNGGFVSFDVLVTLSEYRDIVANIRVFLTQPCYNPALSATVWLPYLLVEPTARDMKIPVYMRLDESGKEISGLSITAKLEFNSAVFIPRRLSTEGNVISNTVDNNGNRIFEFDAQNLHISDTDSILTEIVGDALLGDIESSPLVLSEFNFAPDTIFAPIFPEDGELRLKICKEGGNRLLLRGMPLDLFANPNPANSEINITGNVLESGIHSIELMNVRGNSKVLESWNSDTNKEFDFTIDISGYSSGMYYLILRTPARISVRPVFIIN
ncbi:MAG: choice-of-anchor D domain-containing protein [bacterium]